MEWGGIEQNVLLGAVFTLAIAVLGMLAKTSNNLSATSDALKSHMELNRKLNDELAAAYEERRLLRIDKQELEARLDAVEKAHAKLSNALEVLQAEKGRLGDEVERLTMEMENQNIQNTIVKEALAGQISQLQNALQAERSDRYAVENELRAEIAKLAEENAKLREENAKLAEENSCLRKEVDELSSIMSSIRPDYPNGEEHRDEH